MKKDKGHKMGRGIHAERVQEHSSLRKIYNKKFGLYFTCDERVSNKFEQKNKVIYIRSLFRLLCDE